MMQGDQFQTSLFFKKALYEAKANGLHLSFNIFDENKLDKTLDY